MHKIFALITEFTIGSVLASCIEPNVIDDTGSSIAYRWSYLKLPGTTMSLPIAEVVYWCAFTCLALLTAYYLIRTCILKKDSTHYRAAGLFAIFMFFYLRDYFVTTDRTWYADHTWALIAGVGYFTIITLLNGNACKRLVWWTLILISVQSLYAVSYYLLDIHQFHTPHFGNRTSGTFSNPNTLYPICLLSIPLCLSLSTSFSSTSTRLYLVLIVCITMTALILTYSRSGWIAMSVGFLYLMRYIARDYLMIGWRRFSWIGIIVALFVGSFFIRTRGEILGNSSDRSFWGRVAIWQAAEHIFVKRPCFGYGVGTYGIQQQLYMTENLAAFNPRNGEPKSLYFNLLIEFGVFGLLSFILLVFIYHRLGVEILLAFPEKSYERCLVIGTNAGILAILFAGAFDTTILNSVELPSTATVVILIGAIWVVAKESKQTIEKIEHR